jgi:hypothetical protein
MYILCRDKKIVLKEILGFYKVGVKGVKWKRGYAYILSGRKDRCRVENTPGTSFFCARRRWTAIGMGSSRARPDIDPLATAKD